MYKILYADEVVEQDLPNILKPKKDEIQKAIESKLTSRPEVYTRPLKRSLKGYRKFKVGDYRVVLRIEESVVKIFVIQHRSTVYTTAPVRVRN